MDVIFYAPLGRGIPVERIGGAEVGCRRTLGIYKQARFNVICIDKPMRTGSAVAYLAATAKAYTQFLRMLNMHPDALVHIAGFYDKIIDIEYAFLMTAKSLGHKTIYEIRNGGMIRIYNERGTRYKKRQLQLLRNATGVLCQGQCYVDFIREKLSRDSFYYPNYLDDAYVKPWQPHDFSKGVNLIYFGRIAPSKNVDVAIRCAALVQRMYPDTNLHIVGAIWPDYIAALQSAIADSGMPADSVTMHGRKSLDEITRLLRQAHFFVFPSSEPNEGHSNSLTEAMGCGVVPVASNAGFNVAICGSSALIADSLQPEAYANIIIGILNGGHWQEYSRQAYLRVRDNFTKSIVAPRLIQYISSL